MTALLCVIMLALTSSACRRAPHAESFQGATEGTTYHITVSSLPPGVPRARLQSAIDAALADVDLRLSTWRADSEISRFNVSGSTDWITVSASLFTVLQESQRVALESHGAFDVTVAPLVDLWGFGMRENDTAGEPTAGEIKAARAAVGFEKLELRLTPLSIRKLAPLLRLDVAGIAPGYAVDRICQAFAALGVHDAIVEIGGEVRAWGRNPDGRPWRAAVERPVAGERNPYTLVELDNMAVSTSGDYRDYRVVGQRRVSHTIDPRTGAPVAHDLASVTVLHRSAMSADAYATVLMVLGPEEGYRYAERHGLAILMIARVPGHARWRELVTPGFTRLRRPLP